ncbi:MAG: carboxylesterase family protein [Oscillospiraceae bacterium]|nr:carboxylesterase family protein [Oscillospiraceae bacterium]
MAMLFAKTESGMVEGLPAANQMFSVFRGVPFAAPPVGELRWRDPQPCPAWEGVRECFRFPSVAMQEPIASEGGGIAAKEFYINPRTPSEDCLYLNIWTPAKTPEEKLPVAVYIHGGGHQTGYSYLNCYDGEGFCKRGIVMVTIPYRLNVFGYLCHPDMQGEDETMGNYGVKDQLFALRWVKRNIAAFGGDPDTITIFGQSGGASSVNNLCALPAARGLFQRAIMQSGGGIRPVYSYWSSSIDHAREAGIAFFKELGVTSLAEAREKPSQEVLDAYIRFKNKKISEHDTPSLLGGYMRFSPVDDGVIFPRPVTDLYRSGDYPELDYLLGSTSGEMLETTAQNLAFAEVNAALGRKPCYLYYFTYIPPTADRAHHSVEHHYVFQTLQRSFRPYSGKDWDLSNTLADYWAAFIRTGDPNGEGRATWEPYRQGEYNALEIHLEQQMIDLRDRRELQEAEVFHKAAVLAAGDRKQGEK